MTTQTLTLTDFLLARIAEDEAVAKFPRPDVAAQSARILAEESATVRLAHPPRPGLAGAMEEGCRALRIHNPARVLAECEAKRRIVELHKPVTDPAWPEQVFCDELETGADSAYPCPTIRILAAIYADHPDYREEWKP